MTKLKDDDVLRLLLYFEKDGNPRFRESIQYPVFAQLLAAGKLHSTYPRAKVMAYRTGKNKAWQPLPGTGIAPAAVATELASVIPAPETAPETDTATKKTRKRKNETDNNLETENENENGD